MTVDANLIKPGQRWRLFHTNDGEIIQELIIEVISSRDHKSRNVKCKNLQNIIGGSPTEYGFYSFNHRAWTYQLLEGQEAPL